MSEHQLHVLLVNPRDRHILLAGLAQRLQIAAVISGSWVVCWGCAASDTLGHRSYSIPRIQDPAFRSMLQQPLPQ